MAANDELPRGLTLSSNTPSGPSGNTVTFPATSGVAWVLTNIDASMFSGYEGNYNEPVSTSLGSSGPEGQILVAVTGSGYVEGTYSWQGQAVGASGAALTVTIGNVAGVGGYLTAMAYPI